MVCCVRCCCYCRRFYCCCAVLSSAFNAHGPRLECVNGVCRLSSGFCVSL